MHQRPKYSVLAVLITFCVALLSCGGNGTTISGTIVNPSPVQAQASYSLSSLSGTYTVMMTAGEDAAVISPVTFIGILTFDGNGNITSGTINGASTTYGTSSSPGVTTSCPLTATGKYTLGSNALGTATLTLTGASVSTNANANMGAVDGCFQVPSQLSFSIAAAQQGGDFVFQMAPGNSNVNFSGSAFKQ